MCGTMCKAICKPNIGRREACEMLFYTHVCTYYEGGERQARRARERAAGNGDGREEAGPKSKGEKVACK